MAYPSFDRSRLRIKPLASRQHDLDLSAVLSLDAPLPSFAHPALGSMGQCLAEARRQGAARILMMVAHVLLACVSRFLILLMYRGMVCYIDMTCSGPWPDLVFASL